MAADTPVIVQLSDSHLRTDDPQRTRQFEAVIARVRELQPAPIAVLHTGDIADDGVRECYETAVELLSAFDVPVHLLPGNHDDRANMRSVFGSPGDGPDGEVRYSVQAGPVRILVCDTLIPGHVEGRLDVDWVAAQLAEQPTTPTLIALHHPPVRTGFGQMDAYGLPEETRQALARVLDGHQQVLKIVTGHVHRAAVAQVGRVPVVMAPSVNFQLGLDLAGDSLEVNDDPPGFVIHAWVDGQLVSHLQPVPRVE